MVGYGCLLGDCFNNLKIKKETLKNANINRINDGMLSVSVRWDHRINYLCLLRATVPMLFDACKYLLARFNIADKVSYTTVIAVAPLE